MTSYQPQQYGLSVPVDLDLLFEEATAGSAGAWHRTRTVPWIVGSCQKCGTTGTVYSMLKYALPILRCHCDTRQDEAAWRTHFGILAELADG